MQIVSNTSPIYYLHQISRLDLLVELFGKIVVPLEVMDELKAGKNQGLNIPDVKSFEWVSVRETKIAPFLPMITDLGAGESAVISYAISEPAMAILDDGLARQVASNAKVRLTGTVGVLIQAKKVGLIESLRDDLDAIQSHGFFLAENLKAQALTIAGE